MQRLVGHLGRGGLSLDEWVLERVRFGGEVVWVSSGSVCRLSWERWRGAHQTTGSERTIGVAQDTTTTRSADSDSRWADRKVTVSHDSSPTRIDSPIDRAPVERIHEDVRAEFASTGGRA